MICEIYRLTNRLSSRLRSRYPSAQKLLVCSLIAGLTSQSIGVQPIDLDDAIEESSQSSTVGETLSERNGSSKKRAREDQSESAFKRPATRASAVETDAAQVLNSGSIGSQEEFRSFIERIGAQNRGEFDASKHLFLRAGPGGGYKSDKNIIRGSREMSSSIDRKRQVLRHISIQLRGIADSEAGEGGNRVVEIQGIADDRGNLFIMANQNETLDLIQQAVADERGSLVGSGSGRNRLAEAVVEKQDRVGSLPDYTTERVSRKLQAIESGRRGRDSAQFQGAIKVFESLASATEFERIDMPNGVDVSLSDRMREGVDGSEGAGVEGRVFLLYKHEHDRRHAESRGADLLRMLEYSTDGRESRGASYSSSGTKRNCWVCHARFDLEKSKYGIDLEHSKAPGLLYMNAAMAESAELRSHIIDNASASKTAVSELRKAAENGKKRQDRSAESESDSDQSMDELNSHIEDRRHGIGEN